MPLADAVANVAHGALLTLGLATRRPQPRRAAASRTACTSPTARTCSRSRWRCSSAPRELGAIGATISGAGPTVLFWTQADATGAVVGRAARARPTGWAEVMRAPFESQGADVREL